MSTRSVGSVSPDGVLMLACTEAIRDSQADQQYFLGRLDAYNSVSDAVSKYVRELTDKSRELAAKGGDNPTVSVTTRSFDLAVGASGRVNSVDVTSQLGGDVLANELRKVETTNEALKNRRGMTSTGYQGADQASQQLFTMVASVLKSLHDMASGLVRNVG